MEVKSGNILIAEPFMAEPYFKRAVILVCEHEQHGTTGFMINKPIQMKMESLILDFPKTSAPVYKGGPVATDTVHYLHNVGNMLDDSIEICNGVYWGGDFRKLKFLIENELIKENNIRFFVGYSGWSEGQLEEELKEGSWIVGDMDANYLFKTKPFVMWQKVLFDKGDTFTVISQISDEPQYN